MNTRSILAVAWALAAVPALAQTAQPAPAAKPAQGAQQSQRPDPDAAFDAWDKDKNGQLSREEFRAGWAMARNDLIVQRLAAEFQRQDVNKSGKIEANEYTNLMLVKRLGASAPPLGTFDANKDSALDFDEYLEFVKGAARSQAK